MALCALLAWYDEEPERLHTAIRTAGSVGASALVAVDGAYRLFRDAQASSPNLQRAAVCSAARAAGLELLLYTPPKPWESEMEKRSRLFELGELLTEPSDWYLVLDADYELDARGEQPLPERLHTTSTRFLAGEAYLETPPGPASAQFGSPPVGAIRCLFRAIRGLRVKGNHYTYVAPNAFPAERGAEGIRLWGNPTEHELAPAVDLREALRVVHWTYHRPRARIEAQFDYYRARDADGGERGPCYRCRERTATIWLPAHLKLEGDEAVGGWQEVCEECLPAAQADLRAWALEHDLDPEPIVKPLRPRAWELAR